MDYEKKYKEALERAKELSEGRYGHSVDDIPKDISEYIFPELKESENERIRLEIVSCVQNYGPRTENPGLYIRMIDWLEKQGEHAKFLDFIQVGDKVTRNQDGVLVNLSQLKRVAKPAENKGEQILANSVKTCKDEQKPAWSEEDDQYLLVCKNALSKYQASDKWDAGIISRWFENKLKAPQNKWKPSDEQIEALKGVQEGVFRLGILESLYNDLKKLREK